MYNIDYLLTHPPLFLEIYVMHHQCEISFSKDFTMVTSQLIVLQAIIQGVLYIQQPNNIKEVFVCFDANGIRNDSWPVNWGRMEPYENSALTHPIRTNSTMYKLRLRGGNKWSDTDWLELYSKCSTPTSNIPTNKTNIALEAENQTLSVLTWYIAVCSSFLVISIIAYGGRKCVQNS